MPEVTTARVPYLKPLPVPSALNRPFWEALRDHRFVVPRCRDCGDYNWLPYPACRSCQSEDQPWTEISGHGHVYSFTVVHRGPGAFDAEVPYVMALGQLDERPRPCDVLANLVGIDPDRIEIGLPLQIGYVEVPGEDITLYQWLPR
jgi:uncharacterized OB-fold protein